jgi:hypothetical protein
VPGVVGYADEQTLLQTQGRLNNYLDGPFGHTRCHDFTCMIDTQHVTSYDGDFGARILQAGNYLLCVGLSQPDHLIETNLRVPHAIFHQLKIRPTPKAAYKQGRSFHY